MLLLKSTHTAYNYKCMTLLSVFFFLYKAQIKTLKLCFDLLIEKMDVFDTNTLFAYFKHVIIYNLSIKS